MSARMQIAHTLYAELQPLVADMKIGDVIVGINDDASCPTQELDSVTIMREIENNYPVTKFVMTGFRTINHRQVAFGFSFTFNEYGCNPNFSIAPNITLGTTHLTSSKINLIRRTLIGSPDAIQQTVLAIKKMINKK